MPSDSWPPTPRSPPVQFSLLHSKFHLCSVATRALLLSTYIKFINLFPETKATIQGVLRAGSQLRNADVELQQRAVEYLTLSSVASTDVLVRAPAPRAPSFAPSFAPCTTCPWPAPPPDPAACPAGHGAGGDAALPRAGVVHPGQAETQEGAGGRQRPGRRPEGPQQ